MSTAGLSRISSVLALKATPRTAISILVTSPPQALTTFSTQATFRYLLASITASTILEFACTEFAKLCSPNVSLGNHEPP